MQQRTTIRLGVLGAAAALMLSVLPAAASTRADALSWVALGDSYTAGIFAGPPVGPDDGCERTRDAYPSVAARQLADDPSARPVELVADVSCGAATIADIADEEQVPIGRGAPEGGWPAVPRQVAAVGPDTDVVTIGIGGNSMPFGTILLNCVSGGNGEPDTATPCRDAYTGRPPANDPETIEEKYTRVAHEYREMLAAVSAAAPHARIVTVGYPSLIPRDTGACDRGDLTEFAAGPLGSITRADLTWLHGVSETLNGIIARATADIGGRFVDVAASSQGHDVCTPRAVKWVEGVCGPPESDRPIDLDLLCSSLPAGQRRLTLVHPNSAGHANTAAQVEAAIRDVTS